jgi:hypothetical protein
VSRQAQQLAVGLAALILLVAGGVGGWLLFRGPAAADLQLANPPIDLRASLSPAEPQFADTVTAYVDVFVDTAVIDPATIRLDLGLAPYRRIGGSRTLRRAGRIAALHVEARLECLQAGCIPPKSLYTFTFRPLTVRYRAGGAAQKAQIGWPRLTVHSRLTEALRAHPALRVGAIHAAPPSFRVAPRRAGVALLVAAALLGLAGLAILVALAGRPLLARRRGPGALELILEEVRASSSNGDSARRRGALEQLARELAPLDGELSRESRVLAWAPSDPPPAAVEDLARRARELAG